MAGPNSVEDLEHRLAEAEILKDKRAIELLNATVAYKVAVGNATSIHGQLIEAYKNRCARNPRRHT
jgi:hypothetical protein